MVDPGAFADEQRRLTTVWTFLGFTSDLAKDGDWFRASLATGSACLKNPAPGSWPWMAPWPRTVPNGDGRRTLSTVAEDA